MFCPECGAKNAEQAKFCVKCGSRIARMEGAAGTPQTVPTAPAVPMQTMEIAAPGGY